MGPSKRYRPPAARTGRAQAISGQYGVIFAAMADAVVVYDAKGRIVQFNDAAATMFHMRERLTYLSLPLDQREAGLEMQDPDGHPLRREEWPAFRVLRGERLNGASTPDIRARTPDGRDLILNISGAPMQDARGRLQGAVCIIRDVTVRRALERDVAERAAELESIFATQTEGIAYVDRDGRIIRMNEAQRRLLAEREVDSTHEHVDTWSRQTTPYNALGRPVPREELPFYRALRGETITDEHAVELYQRSLDGRNLVVRISAAPVRNAQGEIVGVVLTTRDVTQQRQLEQQQRDILRVVAHDLLSPITGMRLYFATQERRLSQGLPPLVPDESLLRAMKANLTRMEYLVNDLRAVTSIEAGALNLDRSVCDVRAICEREIAVQRALAPERTIHFEAPEEAIQAEVDEQRIGQLVANYLGNALKYSATDKLVTLTLTADDTTVRLAVRDEGPGIPEKERARLWERFHRVEGIKPVDGSQSLGLGLYICKAVAEAHGGAVGVESVVGEGSTFWCTLPRVCPVPPKNGSAV